jgi:ferredoxin-NADP reductase
VIHVLGNDPGWDGEKGKVDSGRISKLVPDLAGREVFLCGPPVMMRLVRTSLSELGVPKSKIHFEQFNL